VSEGEGEGEDDDACQVEEEGEGDPRPVFQPGKGTGNVRNLKPTICR
jgi:hypothetical protein